MVLSLGCPPIEADIGGTAHLAGRMLITKEGAEPIHDVTPGVIIV